MCCQCQNEGMDRRQFMGVSAMGMVGAGLALNNTARAAGNAWNPDQPLIRTGKPLRIQPVLLYSLPERKPQTSWRSWGGVQTEQDVSDEVKRINSELSHMQKAVDFELDIKPLVKVRSIEEANKILESSDYDVPIVYAASGWTTLLDACFSDQRNNLIFLRHRSGPVYLWYEIIHNRFLRRGDQNNELDEYRYPAGMTVDDIVVDDYDLLLAKLRALYSVHNFIGHRIVALGGSGGWCNPDAPDIAREKFEFDIITVDYADLEKRIKSARANSARIQKAEKWAENYLALPDTTLHTEKQFVINCFLLYDIFRDYLHELDAASFTIQGCMSTVIPIAETTACLSLSLLNDEGYLAFCESDFNVIPSGILLHYVSGKPVFLNDPTFPHHGVVTCAHCTAPRRMDGASYARSNVVTHFESDYGATPKVELPVGTKVSMVCPDGDQKKWLGFTGTVDDNPFYDICRSQYDISIDSDWKKLRRDHRGFHWMMACGDYSEELAYACQNIGIDWTNISV